MDIQQLKIVVKQSNTIKEVLKSLGFSENNTTQRYNFHEAVKKHNIDISHFGKNRFAISSRWKDETTIRKNARQASTVSQFIELMGLKNKGSNYKTAQYHLKRLNIDTTHFVANNNGYTKGTLTRISLQEVLQGQHPHYDRSLLKRRLLKEHIKENKCEECGQDGNWNNRPLRMHIDHIDGVSNNHKLDNLRMLCPNCHSQTETYAGKNRG